MFHFDSVKMANVVKLIARRNRLLSTLNRHSTYASARDDEVTRLAVLDRLENLDQTWREFIEIDDQISAVENQSALYDQHEDTYFQVKSSYFGILSRLESNATPSDPTIDLNSTMSRFVEQQQVLLESMADRSIRNSDVKLPRLSIPSFAGDYKEWPAFKDLLSSSVHSNSNLSNVSKFQYLKGLLRGEAASLIRHMQMTEENYPQAWDKLAERYDKSRHIINAYIKVFMDQSSVNQVNSKNLRQLVDRSDEVIRALMSFPAAATSRDPWLTYILTTKLDMETRNMWALESADLDQASFDDLLKFLNKRCDALESTQFSSVSRATSARGSHSINHSQVDTTSCSFCDKRYHPLFKCFKFRAASMAERRKFVSNRRLCANCFRDGHTALNCPTDRHCLDCSERHHTLLHPASATGKGTSSSIRRTDSGNTISSCSAYRISNSPSASSAQPPLKQSNTPPNHVASLSVNNPCTGSLLPTAVVRVVDSTGGFQLCRALLDSGSQACFISEDCARRLALRRRKSELDITGVSGVSAGSTKGEVTLSMYSHFDNAYHTSTNAHILPTLTSELPPVFFDISDWEYLLSVQLADPSFNVPQKSDLILGADVFFKILKDGRLSGPPGTPQAYNTSFGWVLGGECHLIIPRPSCAGHITSNHVNLDCLLRNFWEIEEPSTTVKMTTPEEDFCEEHFAHNLSLSTDGRFQVALPIRRDSKILGDSLSAARSRLMSMERRFRSNAHLYDSYKNFMAEYESLGHMEPVPVPIRHYRLTTVTYGTSCAPFLATRSLSQVAHEIDGTRPELSWIIRTNFYVDDLISGSHSLDDAIVICRDISNLLARRGFHLRKWSSNSRELLDTIPADQREQILFEVDSESEIIKILGLRWNPSEDMFSFKVSVPVISPTTKRAILSESSRIFDPLGFLSPCVISVKIMFQQLWLQEYGWDDVLPASIVDNWLTLREQLVLIESLKIPRWLHFPSKVQFHGFSDASETAYAAVVYCRSVNGVGHIVTRLVMAKTRVAPIKQVSLPRLELCAAHLLVKLLKSLINIFDISKDDIFAYTDSTIVLAWLSSYPRKWKSFVANRTSEILDFVPSSHWFHVKSGENPADVASRGIMPSLLLGHSLWWSGPSWLLLDQTNWPIYSSTRKPFDTNLECRPSRMPEQTCFVIDVSQPLEILFEKFSSLTKILRILCYCLRFGNSSKHKPVHQFITSAEMQASLNLCIIWCQSRLFHEELLCLRKHKSVPAKSSMANLYPFIDKNGIIRVGGRLRHSQCSFDMKHPIILPKNHALTHYVISSTHLKHLHADITLLSSILRQKFWIIGARNLIKQCIHRCFTCLRYRNFTHQQLMGDLPTHRVNPGRPFINTGVDYAGPVKLKTHSGRSFKIQKGYICLFICFSTKAIHLELVSDLTADAFIAALRRFTSRRGVPCNVYSDNGTNFVGASKKLSKLRQCPSINEKNIYDHLSSEMITWHFIPPSSPHFGGLWEAGIKSVKTHLNKSFGETLLTFEEYTTILSQIEALLNSRPLCPTYENDVSNLDALTPGHFLIGSPLTSLPEPTFIEKGKFSMLQKWNYLQKIKIDFWKRWQKEYLTSLQNRPKWKKSKANLQVGDLVLIKEENVSPSHWALGRILETHPGDDSLVRTVTIKTKNGILKRPVVKLCPLPFVENLSTPGVCSE